MLELDGLPLPTIVYTLLAVAMATLFLSCCWCKKKSASSKLKSASIKGSTNEKTETVHTPAEENKSGNGSVTQCPSPEPKPAAELGDFSAVQRETEILRSYRKPAPPKNRARQSRAPRALNRSTENLDIFTELSEDELKASEETDDLTDRTTDHLDNGRADDNMANQSKSGVDEIDAVKHRSQVNGGAKRDTRSSMLADIEKTLASLHSEEEKLDGNKVSDLTNDKETTTQIETSRSSLPTEQIETNSAQSSPVTKGKVAPKVSPKPTPRKRGVVDKPHENNSHEQTTDSTSKDESKTAVDQTLSRAQLGSTAPSREPVESGSSQAACAQVEICTDLAATTDVSKKEPPITIQESCQMLQGAIIEHKVEVKEIKSTEKIVSTPTEETKLQTTSIQATEQKEETDDQTSTPKDNTQILNTSETVIPEVSASHDADTKETDANKPAEDEQLKARSGALEQQTLVTTESSKAQSGALEQQTLVTTESSKAQSGALEQQTLVTTESSKAQSGALEQQTLVTTESSKAQSGALEQQTLVTTESSKAQSGALEQQTLVTTEISKAQNGALEQQTLVTTESSKAQKEQSPEEKPVEMSKELEKSEKSETVEDQSGKGKLSKIPVRAGNKSGSTSPQDK